MKTNRLLLAGAWLLMLFSFEACKKDKNNNSSTARINMRLTDGPADYDAVYIDVQEVQFKMQGHSTISINPYRRGMYNILNFRNGTDTLLLNVDLPMGNVEQIRLILGPDNYVVDDGVYYKMNTPSAQESGLKLNMHTMLEANASYDVWVDFDAGKSVKQTGNGKYQLKPVIRAYTALTNGRIEGYILPVAAMSTVYVINGSDTLSAIPGPDGYFVVSGLEAGTYKVLVEPAVMPFAAYSVNVNVNFGVVTSIGTVTLL